MGAILPVITVALGKWLFLSVINAWQNYITLKALPFTAEGGTTHMIRYNDIHQHFLWLVHCAKNIIKKCAHIIGELVPYIVSYMLIIAMTIFFKFSRLAFNKAQYRILVLFFWLTFRWSIERANNANLTRPWSPGNSVKGPLPTDDVTWWREVISTEWSVQISTWVNQEPIILWSLLLILRALTAASWVIQHGGPRPGRPNTMDEVPL